MATATTKTKRPPVKKAAPSPSANGDGPLIRVAFNPEDLEALLDRLGDWNDAIAHRLRMRLAKHQQRWG